MIKIAITDPESSGKKQYISPLMSTLTLNSCQTLQTPI